jgi:hypothetical protein
MHYKSSFPGEEKTMPFDAGTIIAIAAALIFYLRLIILQRHKANQTQHAPQKSGKRGYTPQPGLKIISWYLLGAGVAFIFLGALLAASPIFGPTASSLWWLILTVGIFLLGLSIR